MFHSDADQQGNTLTEQLVGIQDILMGLHTLKSVLTCSTTNNQSVASGHVRIKLL